MTRLLVEPQRTRDGDPTGCTGFTMEDGTVYRATRDGHVNVDNPAHVEAALRNPLADGAITAAKFHGAGLKESYACDTCGFSAFAWQASASCPRCGGTIEKEGP
jgi:rubrerythrin